MKEAVNRRVEKEEKKKGKTRKVKTKEIGTRKPGMKKTEKAQDGTEGEWNWGEVQQEAFDAIKKILLTNNNSLNHNL